jgi:RNA polymerase sigma factor (TIGR02999 family)
MRRILVDRARARQALKRGGDGTDVPLDDCQDAQPAKDAELLALDEALTRLAACDPRRSSVVELRYFGGLTAEETGAALGISVETVARDWRTARAWLHHQLTAGGSSAQS